MSDPGLVQMLGVLKQFRDERSWAGFHTLPDLLIGVSVEAAELLECVQWRSREGHALALDAAQLQHLGDEMADVLNYLLLAADKAGIDLVAAFQRKLTLNAQKYPVEAT